MPKECLDCRFVSIDESAFQCARCGGERLRYSVLAGMKFREQKGEAAKAALGRNDKPVLWDRGGQALRFLAASQAAAFVLLGAAIFSTPDDEVPKNASLQHLLPAIEEIYPFATAAMAVVIPAIAAAVGVVLGLRGVYLAQQLGLIFGPVAALISLAGYDAMGGTAPIAAWLFSPILAAALSFVAGLRMTGYIRAEEDDVKTVEYKRVDSWDREAKPKLKALRPARQGYHRKLFWGIGFGGLTTYLFPLILATLSGSSPGELRNANLIFGWAGVLVAGSFAAAGTTAPILQGSLAGALMYFVRHYAHLSLTPEAFLQLWIHVAAGIAGGFAGRLCFPPIQVVHGRKRCTSDGVVYVGDELAKNSV